MAINKNHEFEELNGVRCAIVEKNASKDRMEFLKVLLEINHFTVIILPTPCKKNETPPDSALHEAETTSPTVMPETFIIGVTDLTFNSINALYGRRLKTREGTIVTPAYWNQKETVNREDIPYYEQS
jgi:hypothetical protein